MFCRQCGNELSANVKFCSKCGMAVNANAGASHCTSQSNQNETRTKSYDTVNIQTREGLISGLKNAIRLMNQAAALKERSAETIQKQVFSKTTYKEITGAVKAIFTAAVGILSFLISRKIFSIFNLALLNHYGSTAWMPLPVQLIYYVLSVVMPIAIAVIIAVFFCKNIIVKHNKKIQAKNITIMNENQKIAAYNQSIRQAAEAINCKLREIQLEYQNTVMTWYPVNYCYIEAAEFFLDCVINYRADALKEAINLYEEYLHRERVERNQEEMLKNQQSIMKKQDLNNLLTLGSIIMQGQVLSAVQQNTAAVHGTTAAVKENTEAVRGLYR